MSRQSEPLAPQTNVSQWLDAFFAAYYRERPIDATFIGRHEYDRLLPDFSEAGLDDAVESMRYLLQRGDELVLADASETEMIDVRLATGFLRIQIWEMLSSHFQRGNPSLYAGEAIFGILSLFLSDYAPLSERFEAAIERMRRIPDFLAQARSTIRLAPAAWAERALDECAGADHFLGTGIYLLAAEHNIDDDRIHDAAKRARAAFAAFAHDLRYEITVSSEAEYGCGEEAFTLFMREGHGLSYSGDEMIRYAQEALRKADDTLRSQAGVWGMHDPADVLAQLANLHPTRAEYYERYEAYWQACRTFATEQDLLTWPDSPIEYVPRPTWVRKTAPHLYFLFYRTPPAFNQPSVHQYLVSPLPDTTSAGEQEAFLRAHNDSVIKLNHVIHHGAIGHHIQNWHACRARSRIGRVAAVDGSARIAMFCGGSMAEGWACYATELMREAGFLTPLEEYAEVQTRRRMSARAIVDVKLHRGEFTLDEAAAFYVQQAGMSPAAAHSEAVKNSMFPGAAMMYLFGTDAIYDLRRELEAKAGARFSLRRFHDTFLSYGSIPVALVAESMRSRGDIF
ncbi:MAG: DUF885 family protein [Caldilineaceae bacterium]|nr:DUF885 family protein [Caldilineaceae bacterium]